MSKDKAREVVRKGVLRALNVGLDTGAIEPAEVQKAAMDKARSCPADEKPAFAEVAGKAALKRSDSNKKKALPI